MSGEVLAVVAESVMFLASTGSRSGMLVSILHTVYRMCVCVCVCVLVAQLYLTLCNPMTVTHQAPLSVNFSRHEYWSG